MVKMTEVMDIGDKKKDIPKVTDGVMLCLS